MKNKRERIVYGVFETDLGAMILAQSVQGLCWLGFMVAGYKGDGLSRLKGFFPDAEIARDDAALQTLKDQVLRAWEMGDVGSLLLDLRGTAFQKAVWNALLNIPKGRVCSYGDVANDIGRPKAARAVGSAVGENPVSLLVPCHRVVRGDGGLGNYGWGLDIKRDLLVQEGAIAA